MSPLNFKHLHYFWVVAQEGSITRAADRLGVAIQTISGQLSLLERQLGKALFNSQGRGLVLSDAGRVALGYAETIGAADLLGQDMHALIHHHHADDWPLPPQAVRAAAPAAAPEPPPLSPLAQESA